MHPAVAFRFLFVYRTGESVQASMIANERVNKAIDYLCGRNYSVGQSVFTSGLRITVDGKFLTGYQVRLLATYESCKDEDAKPDGLAFDYMARACRKIAEHPSAHSLVASEGRELANLWKNWDPLTEVSEAQLRVLCRRMGYFLTQEFEYLWWNGKA